MSILQNKALHSVSGFLVMGGWAVFANRHHGVSQALLAGVVQGAITAVITLLLKRIVEEVFVRTSGWVRFVLPAVLAFLVSVVVLTVLHKMAGTPELLMTLVVPNTVSTLYALLYTITLSRHA